MFVKTLLFMWSIETLGLDDFDQVDQGHWYEIKERRTIAIPIVWILLQSNCSKI